jgi:two-component system chemotaxis response regulator CheY
MSLDFSTPVLVVDDSTTMGRIISTLLRQIGFQNVDIAHGGTTALAKMRASPYGLVISDWNMQPVTGLDLLKQIRSDEAHARTCFVMITAEAHKEHVWAAREAGADGYIVKPFTAQILQARLISALDRRRGDGPRVVPID